MGRAVHSYPMNIGFVFFGSNDLWLYHHYGLCCSSSWSQKRHNLNPVQTPQPFYCPREINKGSRGELNLVGLTRCRYQDSCAKNLSFWPTVSSSDHCDSKSMSKCCSHFFSASGVSILGPFLIPLPEIMLDLTHSTTDVENHLFLPIWKAVLTKICSLL